MSEALEYRVEKFVDDDWKVINEASTSEQAFAYARADAGKYLVFRPLIFSEGDGMLSEVESDDDPLYRIIRV